METSALEIIQSYLSPDDVVWLEIDLRNAPDENITFRAVTKDGFGLRFTMTLSVALDICYPERTCRYIGVKWAEELRKRRREDR